MPPEDQEQPSSGERQFVTGWIKATLDRPVPIAEQDPGRVTIRRLNRAEYNNTIRDLVGVDFHPADDFPADDVGYGFDNIGDVLSLSPIFVEKYLRPSSGSSSRPSPIPPPPRRPARFQRRSDAGHRRRRAHCARRRRLTSNGDLTTTWNVP